jgi:hypothetical protein
MKVKIQKLYMLKIEPLRAVDAKNGGIDQWLQNADSSI